MSVTVCLNANTLGYPTGGGHRWVYLNWALGLRANGCRVIWMEGALPEWGAERIRALTKILQEQLRPYAFGDAVAVHSFIDEKLPAGSAQGCMDADEVAADLLVDMGYGARQEVVDRYRHSVLIDIDPGILQIWVSMGQVKIAGHKTYFTIGETVGRPGSNLPDVGLRWHYTPPCVSLEAWPVVSAGGAGAPFTTVSQWRGGDWILHGDESYSNEKRDGFLPYLDLPGMTHQPLELALGLGKWEDDERQNLLGKGWRVRQAAEVTATPADYQKYIQGSAGEFSCCKPSCVRLRNAWISDRTLCYMASGKPAVVQHTGDSRFLPDAEGLFRFKTPAEAAAALAKVGDDYERQSAAARALAEEHFDAKKLAKRLLEVAMG